MRTLQASLFTDNLSNEPISAGTISLDSTFKRPKSTTTGRAVNYFIKHYFDEAAHCDAHRPAPASATSWPMASPNRRPDSSGAGWRRRGGPEAAPSSGSALSAPTETSGCGLQVRQCFYYFFHFFCSSTSHE
jgi:hypothetical protein